jgi:energy-coupling factor transporter transmembrane protein EcfT
VNIGSIDRSAVSDLGWLHRISPTAKLIAFGLVLAAIVVTWNLFVAVALLVLLAATAASARIDLRLAFTLAAYPALFALIFAVASAPDALSGATIVAKAVAAGLAAVTIVLTTPYPQVFAPIQRIVPGVVGDALLMTYRTTFLLLGKFGQLVRAVRLRAGIRGAHPVRMARATTAALGSLLLYALDLAQRDYDVMRLRGYSGRLRVPLPRSISRGRDALLLAAASVALGVSVAWRLRWQTLNPYSWLLPLIALALLAVAAITRRTTTQEVDR